MNDIERKSLEKHIDDLELSHLSLENDSDGYFATVIGNIEDVIMEDDFSKLLTSFMDKHWREFEDAEENKLIYTDIFKEYLETIEKYIEEKLRKNIAGFDMNIFENELKKRENELDGQIFEILDTFSNFEAFKSMLLDYRNMKMGHSVDFSMDISVKKYMIEMESEETGVL
ncbi:ADP-ribosylation factor-like protein 2-binding protein [Coccinella septempunctata]|uniref:ADP-ribosylation factor-like protein 2-binding protein n=1 Tax=Coccinella septempunctata TaxID=41139 RepID=UPI001D06BC8D|nr:ADP-ribosylation factor-like protein 2-binding protein [Coccinella septempunctata]